MFWLIHIWYFNKIYYICAMKRIESGHALLTRVCSWPVRFLYLQLHFNCNRYAKEKNNRTIHRRGKNFSWR